MSVIAVYLFYAWIVIIHACFIGISAFAIWGKRLSQMNPIAVMVMLILPLVFLEFYWIPFANYLDLSLTTGNKELLDYFSLSEGQNLVSVFGFGYIHLLVFSLGGYLAYRIGKWTYQRKVK